MNAIYAYKLNLPFKFNAPEINVSNPIVKYELPENTKFLKFLENIGLTYYINERFFLHPYNNLPIHVDTDRFNEFAKLNFVIGGKGSVIKWYNPNPNTTPLVATTPVGTKYLKPKSLEDIVEVFSLPGDGVTLFNSGHYHGVFNGPEERTTYSFMLKDIKTQEHVNWADAVEKFKDYLI